MPTRRAEKMYTPREAAQIWGLHYHTILSYIAAGYFAERGITVIRLPSGHFRFSEESIQKFIESLEMQKQKKSRSLR